MKKLLKDTLYKIGWKLSRLNVKNDFDTMIMTVIDYNKINYIVDVGANEGQFAQKLRQGRYNGMICSVEPLNEAWNKLSNHASRDEKWIIHEKCALGEESELKKINVSKNTVSSSILQINELHVQAENESEYVGTELVKVKTLDQIFIEENLTQTSHEIMLKLDCQGYEFNILSSTSNIDKIRVIVCELSILPLYNNQKLWHDVHDYIVNKGFDLWGFYPEFVDHISGRVLQLNGIYINESQ